MDAREEIKKTLLTEPLKKLIGYILALVSPLLLALIPRIRDLIQSAISFSLLLMITSVLLSGLLLLAAYTYHLRKKIKQPIPFNENENRFFDFRMTSDSSNWMEFEVWYFYTGTLGLDDIWIHYSFFKANGEWLPIDSISPRKIMVSKIKAIAKMAHNNQSYKGNEIQISTEIEICMAHNHTEFHCQRFPLVKKWIPKNPEPETPLIAVDKPAPKPPALEEIKILILIGIARGGGSCLIDEIAEWFELSGEPLNPVKLDRHLHDLQKQGYVMLHQSPVDMFPGCSLTQKGREYLDDNRLLDAT